MKFQILFSGKKNRHIMFLSSAELAKRGEKVQMSFIDLVKMH